MCPIVLIPAARFGGRAFTDTTELYRKKKRKKRGGVGGAQHPPRPPPFWKKLLHSPSQLIS